MSRWSPLVPLLSLCPLVAACADDTAAGPLLPDAGSVVRHDLAPVGTHDLRAGAPDLGAPPPDLATGGDDQGAGGADLASLPDLAAPPADLAAAPTDDGGSMMPDLASPPDLLKPPFTTIFMVIFENTSYNQIVGAKDAPYFNSLIKAGGLATNYKDSGSHPSLPNYLYLISGATQYIGLFDISPTTTPFPVDKDHLGKQLTTAKVPWRAYMESMSTSCRLTDNPPYAAKHNPFVYFKNLQKDDIQLCQKVDVDYTNFAADLAAGTYRFMWVTPNLNNDGHDTDVKTQDAWAAKEIQKILDSAVYKAGGILFVTWDEGSGFIAGDQVPMIILSPMLKKAGMQSSVAYTHASWLATVEDDFKLPRLGAAANAKTLSEFFQ